MSAPDRVLLFLKAPRPGTVKTRLAADLGPDAACAAYRRLVEHQLALLRHAPFALEIHHAPPEPAAAAELRSWLDPLFPQAKLVYHPQGEGDLGARLACASADAFARGARRIALIGGDCPSLHASRIETAFALLASPADAVFGPAKDGGYYLLALSAPRPELFRDIPWSSPDTLAASLARAGTAGLRVELLPEAEDVDDLASWHRALPLLEPRK